MILDSDSPEYGGHHRLVAGQEHQTSFDIVANRQFHLLSLYLPSRTALVLLREKKEEITKNELFGIWKNNDIVQDVDGYVRGLRKGKD